MIITSRRLIRATTARLRLRVPEQHVAVAHERAAVERDRDLDAARGLLAEAVLLRLPVVEREHVDGRAPTAARPIPDRRRCPGRVSMRITRPASAEEVLLVERDRLQRRHRRVLAVDGDREGLRD